MKGLTQMDFDSAVTKSSKMTTGRIKPPGIKPIRFNPRMNKGFRMPTMPQIPSTDYSFLKELKGADRMFRLK